jgi:hypothetical protein
LHPKKRPKWFKEKNGRKKVAVEAQPTDLGSYSGDETKVTVVQLSGKIGDGYDSRIMKHTKINTLLYNGYQANLILE